MIKIEGMTCHSCASLIEDSLMIDGVTSASVSFADKTAQVVYNDSLVNSEMLCKAIIDAEDGKFKPTVIQDSSQNNKIIKKEERRK